MSQELVPISQNSSICLGTYTLGNWALGHGSSALGHGSLALGHGSCALGPRILALGPGNWILGHVSCALHIGSCAQCLRSWSLFLKIRPYAYGPYGMEVGP